MDLLLAAIFGALATAVIGPLTIAAAEVKRHNRQVAERDEDLEEWLVVRDRQLQRRLNELKQQANAAGVAQGGAIRAGRVAVQTQLLYDYREELRQARAFVLRIAADERWTHRLVRLLKREPLPALATPSRAERLLDFWSEGTARNALSWSLDDILGELPARTPSRALEPSEG